MGNRFDGLRLAAALAVFVAHGEFLYRLSLPAPFQGHSLGSLAVYLFFFVSGYLISQSWAREPSWAVFWVKRLLRVFPGLLAAVAFTVLVGGMVTTWTAGDYWSASQTWAFFANNALGLATLYTLPGVFENNPFAGSANGSLWTIRYELAMYLLLAAAASGLRGRRWVYPAVALGLALAWWAARHGRWDEVPVLQGQWRDLFRWSDFCGFGVPFFLGSSFAAYGMRSSAWLAGAAVAAWAGAVMAGGALLRQMAVWALIACGTFYVAHVGRGRPGPPSAVRSGERMDLSYGIYVYAFPVQQAMTEWSLREGWSLGVCLALSLGAVVPLALLSWVAVERPCIRWARQWRPRAWSARRSMPAASS